MKRKEWFIAILAGGVTAISSGIVTILLGGKPLDPGISFFGWAFLYCFLLGDNPK